MEFPYYGWLTLLILMLLVWAVAGVKRHYQRRAARAFGVRFEVQWLALATNDLKRYPLRLTPNIAVPGLGDADLLVEKLDGQGRVQQRIVVEIKSFIFWETYFFGLYLGRRERDAVAQVTRLQNRMQADSAIVWIPQGKMSFWQRIFSSRKGHVRIVAGGTHQLSKFLMA